MLRTVGRTDGPSYTCSVTWDFDPGKLIRPRSADSIKASGHGAASKGRTHDRKRPRPSRQLRKSLHAGGHPHMRHHRFTRISRTDFELSFEGVPKIGWSLASRAPRVGFARAAEPVANAIVFAVDVSGSVNSERYELQRAGIAAIFADQRI